MDNRTARAHRLNTRTLAYLHREVVWPLAKPSRDERIVWRVRRSAQKRLAYPKPVLPR